MPEDTAGGHETAIVSNGKDGTKVRELPKLDATTLDTDTFTTNGTDTAKHTCESDGEITTTPMINPIVLLKSKEGHEVGADEHTKKLPALEESDRYTKVPSKSKGGSTRCNALNRTKTGKYIPDLEYLRSKDEVGTTRPKSNK